MQSQGWGLGVVRVPSGDFLVGPQQALIVCRELLPVLPGGRCLKPQGPWEGADLPTSLVPADPRRRIPLFPVGLNWIRQRRVTPFTQPSHLPRRGWQTKYLPQISHCFLPDLSHCVPPPYFSPTVRTFLVFR